MKWIYELRNDYSNLVKVNFDERWYKALMKANMGVFDYVNNNMNIDESGFESKPKNDVLTI